jgi:spermidine synthase
MTYLSGPPPEIGLLIDGDNLLPVVQASAAPTVFAGAMPAAVPLELFEQPDVLILGAGGGLDAWIALNNGARSVVAVEGNSLVVEALRGTLHDWAGLADDPRVHLLHREIRTYARQSHERFDMVQLALTDSYRPVTSGAFTLTENYALTVEAFRDYLDLLRPEGVFVVTRWLQTPPSEEVRTLGLILAALDPLTADPAQHVIAFRSFQTITFLVKRAPFSPAEIAQVLAATERLQYDMVLAPDLPPARINQYARLPEPIYHRTLSELLRTNDRAAFYAAYDFDVRPPTDDRPFFFHFFKWRQTPAILNNLGRTWQPFGGSGYFVLVALLIFATLAAGLFVVLPVALARRFRQALRAAGKGTRGRVVIYFAGLGLAYLFIEVATLQQFVLILGQPTLAMATVLATLLLASGVGSALSDRLPWGTGMVALTVLVALWPRLIPAVFSGVLGLEPGMRWALSVLALLPLGLLMGIPFARGLSALRPAADLLPWAWAINGGASVISGVLAPLLALSGGFSWVLWAGAVLYGLAWLTRPTLTRG